MGEAKTMKLSLLFIVMELLTVLAYPIVFVYGRLHRFSKSKDRIAVPNLLITVPATPGKWPMRNHEHAKERL